MSPPKTTRVTMKSLHSLQEVLNERDNLREMVESQHATMNDQRKSLFDAWAESRELRSRLDALHNILHGATQVARVPQLTVGQCDVAMAPESPR